MSGYWDSFDCEIQCDEIGLEEFLAQVPPDGEELFEMEMRNLGIDM